MKPINTGGHSAYQDRVLAQLRKYYPDADSSIDAATWDIMEQFWCLDLSPVDQIIPKELYCPDLLWIVFTFQGSPD